MVCLRRFSRDLKKISGIFGIKHFTPFLNRKAEKMNSKDGSENSRALALYGIRFIVFCRGITSSSRRFTSFSPKATSFSRRTHFV